jgi:hypothetical protein
MPVTSSQARRNSIGTTFPGNDDILGNGSVLQTSQSDNYAVRPSSTEGRFTEPVYEFKVQEALVEMTFLNC